MKLELTRITGAQKFKDDRNIYHVSNKNLGAIKNPLDNLFKGGGVNLD
jgi:hypothetical protein